MNGSRPPGAVPDLTVLIARLRAFFEHVVIPEKVVIRDFEGKSYELPGALPGRRELKLFREIMKLSEVSVIRDVGTNVASLTGSAALQLLLRLALEEEVADHLAGAFEIAHPDLCKDDPLDRFPIEEIVAGLLPYVLRFVKRGGMVILGADPGNETLH